MEEDIRQSGMNGRLSDVAGQLARESLDSYSLAELDARTALLENEILRVKAHRAKSAAHRLAADSLFKSPE